MTVTSTPTPADAGVGTLQLPPTDTSLLARASMPESEYGRWIQHITPASGCEAPIRLRGTIEHVHTPTGAVLASRSTDEMPDGVIYKACGNRRATVCTACSRVYQGDAYQLIKAGITGGKGVPGDICTHPAVFATFTAPSFGPVHTRGFNRSTGAVGPCRGRKTPDLCPHGKDLRCLSRHHDSDPLLGTPLCLDCYDYETHVAWHAFASSELWRRTLQRANRLLKAALSTKHVRISYAKVVEYQQRGAIHFHALTRIDATPTSEGTLPGLPPQATTQLLETVLRQAAETTTYRTPEHPELRHSWSLQWGKQLDIRPLRRSLNTDELTDTKVAAYIAKYSTKGVDTTGSTASRITPESIDTYADRHGTHMQRLTYTAWTLGAVPATSPFHKLQRWAHQYGYGGHFLTKTRHYSTTFKILRAARQHHHHPTTAENTDIPLDEIETVTNLHYLNRGWQTEADHLLATSIHARAREWKDTARNETATT